MQGIEYKIIRMSYGISAQKIAKKFGYKSKTPVLNAEKLSIIPDKYVLILEQLTGLNLQNEENLERIITESLIKFITLDPRNSIWRSEYAEKFNFTLEKM